MSEVTITQAQVFDSLKAKIEHLQEKLVLERDRILVLKEIIAEQQRLMTRAADVLEAWVAEWKSDRDDALIAELRKAAAEMTNPEP